MLAGFARWIGFLTMTLGVVALVLLAGGFFWFAMHVDSQETTIEQKADGIVVLTGGTALNARVASAGGSWATAGATTDFVGASAGDEARTRPG